MFAKKHGNFDLTNLIYKQKKIIMIYLKNFEGFNFERLLESEDLVKNIEEIEKRASQANIDLQDEDTQKALCADLIDQFNKGNISPEYKNMDFEKISNRISSQKESLKFYDFISEAEEAENLEGELEKFKSEFRALPDFDLVNEIENFGKDGTLLKKLRPTGIVDEKILKMEKEIEEYLSKDKGKITSFFDKIGSFTKKFFMGILNAIGKIAGWIKKLLMSCVFWFCRKVLGLSHTSTAFYGPLFTGFAVASVIGIILSPILAAGVAVFTGGAIISAITGAISGAFSMNIIVKVVLNIMYMIYYFAGMRDIAKYTSFMEFIDGLEKKLGKKIKMSYDTRQFFINLDWDHNTKIRTFSGAASKVARKTVDQIEEKKKRIKYLHTMLDKYLELGLDKISEDFPIFAKMIKGVEPTEQDRKKFKDYVDNYLSGIDDLKTKYGDKGYGLGVQAIHKSLKSN